MDFLNYISGNPVNKIQGDNCIKYLQLLEKLQNDRNNKFMNIIATNLLRSMMLEKYDKILRKKTDTSYKERNGLSHKEELYNKFIINVGDYCQRHKNVSFYADKLCISERYLAELTRENTGKSPKQIINERIIREIKILLTFSELTLEQIADNMNFPYQSYLGRFFKRYTGISLKKYRENEICQ